MKEVGEAKMRIRFDSAIKEPFLRRVFLRKSFRASLEIIVEFSAIFIYIWFLQFAAPLGLKILFLSFLIGFPLYCIFKEQEKLPEFSLDSSYFLKGLEELFFFTFTATFLLLTISLYLQEFFLDKKILPRLFEYIFWAFFQQMGLQTFLARRVQKLISHPIGVALFCATLFSLIHLPNLPLMMLTWVGGFFWVRAYLKSSNLYSLSVSHGWLAVLVRYSLPETWLRDLKIGPWFYH